MNIDFEKALTYIAKDPGWVNKLLAGAGILLSTFAVFLIPLFMYIVTGSVIIGGISFFLCFFLSIVLTLVMAGYFVQTANRRINFSNSFLPDWNDLGHLTLTGLKYFVGHFLYFLPLMICSFIFCFALVYVMSHNSGFHVSAFALLTVFGAALLLFGILVFIFCPLMMANYFKTMKILSFVDFKEAFKMLKCNAGNYFILLLLFLAIEIMAQMICSFLFITVIGIMFIPVLYFYIYLVAAEVTAQFVLTAKEKEMDNNSDCA